MNTPAILPGKKLPEHVPRCSLVQEATQSGERSLLGAGLYLTLAEVGLELGQQTALVGWVPLCSWGAAIPSQQVKASLSRKTGALFLPQRVPAR